jgi:nitrite reductase/ring-hydroxylating ferredoxin subunit
MSNFVKLASQSELPPEGEAKEFLLGDKVPLGQGMIEGDKVVCPWHGWQWDPKTGQAAHNPGAKVAVYPIKIEAADVMIEV